MARDKAYHLKRGMVLAMFGSWFFLAPPIVQGLFSFYALISIELAMYVGLIVLFVGALDLVRAV